jgi:hypothetical protein
MGAAMTKRPNKSQEQFGHYPIEMLESPAWSVLSRGAHQFLSLLAIELAHHGGKVGGGLPLTFEHCQEYGMHPDSIAPAMREVEALGFVDRVRQGRGGNAAWRQSNLWRPTYLHARTRGYLPTHEWKKIKTIEEPSASPHRRGRQKTSITSNSNSGDIQKLTLETRVGTDPGNPGSKPESARPWKPGSRGPTLETRVFAKNIPPWSGSVGSSGPHSASW